MIRRSFMLGLVGLILWACGGQGISTPVAPTAVPSTVALAPTLPPSSIPAPSLPTVVPTRTATPTVAATATPTLITSASNGRPALTRGALTQRPLVAMIDNHPNAYPQTGLDEAALVFEALAEYGITRYMAVYAPEIKPIEGDIGPIRSARIYFVQWAMGFRGVYAHAGGSPAGLDRLAADADTLVINIDFVDQEDKGIFDFSRRERSRLAPHNLYTNQSKIENYLTQRVPDRVAADVQAVGYLFAPDDPAQGETNPISSVGYYFLSPDAPVSWQYDAAGNQYSRFRSGIPHVDGVSGVQLAFKSVTVMEVNEAPIPGDPKGRIDQDVIGTGAALVFANGTQTAATWRKDSEDSPLRFYDDQGAEIVFPAGPMWIAAVPSLSHVSTRQ